LVPRPGELALRYLGERPEEMVPTAQARGSARFVFRGEPFHGAGGAIRSSGLRLVALLGTQLLGHVAIKRAGLATLVVAGDHDDAAAR
jgi:hypothetical protein